MEDLLSAALSESGLEFDFDPAATATSDGAAAQSSAAATAVQSPARQVAAGVTQAATPSRQPAGTAPNPSASGGGRRVIVVRRRTAAPTPSPQVGPVQSPRVAAVQSVQSPRVGPVQSVQSPRVGPVQSVQSAAIIRPPAPVPLQQPRHVAPGSGGVRLRHPVAHRVQSSAAPFPAPTPPRPGGSVRVRMPMPTVNCGGRLSPVVPPQQVAARRVGPGPSLMRSGAAPVAMAAGRSPSPLVGAVSGRSPLMRPPTASVGSGNFSRGSPATSRPYLSTSASMPTAGAVFRPLVPTSNDPSMTAARTLPFTVLCGRLGKNRAARNPLVGADRNRQWTSQHGAGRGKLSTAVGVPSRTGGSSAFISNPGTAGMALSKPASSSPTLSSVLRPDARMSKLSSNLAMGTAKPDASKGQDGGNKVDNQAIDDGDEEEGDLGHAGTYADYMPAKLRSGEPHPDPVVETASLAAVPPPPIQYHLSIPEPLIDSGALSALQLEAVIYACQKHEVKLPSGERAGYLVGDGAGVGKGRTISGIIYENYLLGRKRSIWFSVSADLKYDAERDLMDIDAGKIRVHSLNKMKYVKISSKENGSVKKGVIFATYSGLIGECRTAKSKYRSRLKQLLQWCGYDFDGVIVFDECHRAKNLIAHGSAKPSKTGSAVLELQNALPNARIVYASATGASEPRHMAYMTRLGLWGPGRPFVQFTDFISAVEKRGVGAMEIVAMDMKQRGVYLARQLSFRDVSFRIENVPLSEAFIKTYDEAVKLWIEARRQFELCSDSVDMERSARKAMWAQFWASHQRFFKYLCIGAKVPYCVRLCRDALRNGKCCVIGLQSTGEARTLETLDEAGGELNDFVSTAKAVFISLVDKHFPVGSRAAVASSYGLDLFGRVDSVIRSVQMRRRMDDDGGGPGDAKRARFDLADSSSGSCSGSSSGSSDSSTEAESDNETGRGGGANVGGASGGDDWFGTLMNEAASSSSDDEPQQSDSDNEASASAAQTSTEKAEPDVDEDAGEINFDDLDDDSYWASKQKMEDSSPEKVPKFASPLTPVVAERRKKKKRRKHDRSKPIMPAVTSADVTGARESAKEFLDASKGLVDETGAQLASSSGGGDMNASRAAVVKAELLAAVERLGDQLPANTLDQLIDQLGGSVNVAEMTGRKGRVVVKDDGQVVYELRHESDAPIDLINITEKQRFLNGDKLIAIISEAASSGISLHADRRAGNQRRRVHVTLELPWSADKAIQQFGRTHRSNQVHAPEYVFMISGLAGEQRFASTVAKRLESLGALTHGDRRATESRDLSHFNLDTRFGRLTLELVVSSVIGKMQPIVPPPADYDAKSFFEDMQMYLQGVGLVSRCATKSSGFILEKEAYSMAKFLNRLLGLPVRAQNCMFQYFLDTHAELISRAKREGQYDQGILDLGVTDDSGEHVDVSRTGTLLFTGAGYQCALHTIRVHRGCDWEHAYQLFLDHSGEMDGFYLSQYITGRSAVAMLYAVGKKRLETGDRLFCVVRPNTGRNSKLETFSDLKKRFRRKVLPDEAQGYWNSQYEASGRQCQHAFVFGKCSASQNDPGAVCDVGRRAREYHVLSGAVLSVWPLVESVLETTPTFNRRASKVQVIRVKPSGDAKIVGVLVPQRCLSALKHQLQQVTGRPPELVHSTQTTDKPTNS